LAVKILFQQFGTFGIIIEFGTKFSGLAVTLNFGE